MQSKTSFFNVALFKKNLGRTWIVGLLYFIVLTIAMPISFVISMSNFENNWYAAAGYTKAYCLYENISYMGTGIWTFIIAIVLAGITFWYLFFKRDNYMVHAFPVSRKSLFCTGFVSCSIVGIAPLLLNAVIMTIIAAIEGAYAFDAIWYFTLVGIVSTELFLAIWTISPCLEPSVSHRLSAAKCRWNR